MDGQCLKNFHKINLNRQEVSQFNEDFTKNSNKESDERYFLEDDV